VVRVGALVVAAALVAAPGRAPAAVLPPLVFEDQHGRRLELAALRGDVAVIVYGGRSALDDSIAWGRRVAAELRARNATAGDPADRVVAVAQMGGIPPAFRGLLRAMVRERTPPDFSLYLDWDDRLGAAFGAMPATSTVVVTDRDLGVRAVVSGRPEGAPWAVVAAAIQAVR
jgi:hypothetical protein